MIATLTIEWKPIFSTQEWLNILGGVMVGVYVILGAGILMIVWNSCIPAIARTHTIGYWRSVQLMIIGGLLTWSCSDTVEVAHHYELRRELHKNQEAIEQNREALARIEKILEQNTDAAPPRTDRPALFDSPAGT